MAKIKLTESRVSLAGSHRAGDVIEVDAKSAERIVGAHQAEYVGDPKKTAEARAKFGVQPIEQVVAPPKPKANPKKKAKSGKQDPEIGNELDDLDQLPLDEKIVATLREAGFQSIDQIDEFLDNEGDLTSKPGIGKATAGKILATLDELDEEDPEEDLDDEELDEEE